MLFGDTQILIRGGGDLATGVAYRLHKAGFPIMVLELPWPMVVRRRVALATAVHEGEVRVEGLVGRRVDDLEQAIQLASRGLIPVLVSPRLPVPQSKAAVTGDMNGTASHYCSVLIDARMAKRNIDTLVDQAPTVIALGPGFTAGVDCHAVVETMRGHSLGRVIWEGRAQPDTGTPGRVGGKASERVIRAPADGTVDWRHEIGDLVKNGERLGSVNGKSLVAPFDGVIRGLITPGTRVRTGLKIGDVDIRADVASCFTISDKALAIGGGVLEAILSRMNLAG